MKLKPKISLLKVLKLIVAFIALANSIPYTVVAAELPVEKEFADKQLAAAMAALEQARAEALRQQLYIERVAQPKVPDSSLEPDRVRGVLTTFVLGLLFWGIVSLLISGVREHNV